MKYAIVFNSRSGSTKMLAEKLRELLPEEDCLYFGLPSPDALGADRLYMGFWTDRGSCDANSADFLRGLRNTELFLFGTAGFGGDRDCFDSILRRTAALLHPSVQLAGSFMCQGRMPMAVRKKYEAMLSSPASFKKARELILNFDSAQSHPDEADFETLKKKISDI